MLRCHRLAVALAGTAGLACAGPAGAAPLLDSVPHITATGRADAEVVPDQADIRLKVGNERRSAAEATAATAEQATAVVEAIRAQGIATADIRSSFSLAAQYDTAVDPQSHIGRRILRGYAAETAIAVRVRDVAKAGALARSLIEKGADGVEGIDYSYSKEDELRRRLGGEAARDAMAEARAATEALGARLGRVLQIGGEEPGGRPVFRTLAGVMPSGAANRAAVPIEPGTQHVMRSLTVTFEILGPAMDAPAGTPAGTPADAPR